MNMPILRRILDGDPVRCPCDHEPLRLNRGSFREAVHFDVQVAADIYWQGKQDYYLMKDFGPLKLPYPVMWMEWQVPKGSVVDGKPCPELEGCRCGVLLTEDYQIVKSEGDRRTSPGLDCTYFQLDIFGKVLAYPVTDRVETDELGAYQSHQVAYDSTRYAQADAERLNGISAMMGLPAYLALGLINCKNVSTQETGRVGLRRSGKQKRRKAPVQDIRYHTIILPGSGSTVEGKPGKQVHRAAAMHRVRGHFKKFTAESPLLGKHVGTYWWGWQVRGNKDNGQVVSDYKVAI